jgi:hypothetical protein
MRGRTPRFIYGLLLLGDDSAGNSGPRITRRVGFHVVTLLVNDDRGSAIREDRVGRVRVQT